ncbi:MAG TPA: alkaline phosphatase family protein [Candidatus Cybelea sp.]|jgi:phospholipase C|nr:alkaline phosphatase family protein [Candidatus Cybelea sp.]
MAGRATQLAPIAAALALASCGGGSSLTTVPPAPPHQANKIQHVVIVVQENRSFNDLFYGFPGAHTVGFGRDTLGRKIALKPIGLETTWDLDHSSYSFFTDCNGTGSFPGTGCRMNGFNKEYVGCGHKSYPPCPFDHPAYAYVPHEETKPYFEMARRYVLADRMFASNFDASSFISHQYIIAGQANTAVNYPDSSWGCEGGYADLIGTVTPQRTLYGGYVRVCFDDTTLGDELDAAGIPWAFYAASYSSGYINLWSAYQAIRHVYYGPDWKKDVLPNTSFFDDVERGRLRTVSWITPTCANSDHAGCGSNTGPSWVTSLVNAIGKSKYWNSTAIFVFWDDYGGWYDDIAPKMVDYDGLGLRLPLLIISPYAKKGYVSHVHYEHGSILKFVEDQFGLPRLAASDTRANSPELDAFDFSKPPRRFTPIPAPHGEAYFRHQPPDLRPPDSQ